MALPPCHSRRLLEGRTDLFFCAHPRVHAKDHVVKATVCLMCDHWRRPAPAEFRPFPLEPAALPRGRCMHLDEPVGFRECPGCRGTVRVKVFACGDPRHGETTLRECETCPDFEPRPL